MSSGKATIDRALLEKHGVIFSENVYSPDSSQRNENETVRIPEHVEYIRESLLEYDIRIPSSLLSLFQVDFNITNADYSMLPPQSVFFPIPQDVLEPMSREIKETKDKYEQVARLSRISREYAAADVSQDTWEHFLRSYIFQSFEDSTIQTSKYGKLFDTWCLKKTKPWSEAISKSEQISEDYTQPTFTYGFPVHIHNTDNTSTGFNRKECIANFSINTLADLSQQITSCPTLHPRKLKMLSDIGLPFNTDDLICFPWALVEVQSAKESAELCYCRAASGAHTALNILKELYQPPRAGATSPPVITFTCCGPEIRVWLSFSPLKIFHPSTRMVCIWAGSLTATWCIVTLREIVQNMTFWAARVLKPEIASRITQIRATTSASQPHPFGTISSKTAPQGIQTLTDPDTSKAEKPMSSGIQSVLSSSTRKIHVLRSPNSRKAVSVPFRGKRIIVRLPSHDDRKSGKVNPEDWNIAPMLHHTVQPITSEQKSLLGALLDRKIPLGSDENVTEHQADRQTVQSGHSNKAEANNKADDKLGFEENTLNSGGSEREAPRKKPMLDVETQGTHLVPPRTPGTKSFDASTSGFDDVKDDSFSNYFIYRTLESFHGRNYDETIWDSEGDNDESYVPSSSEPDSESSNDISLEEDNADDEASESTYSHDYDTAYEDQPLKQRNVEPEIAESPSSSFWAPPGQVSKLTLADRDDLMYCAANVISGEDFMRLKSIQDLLENLKGVDLLDVTWRSLEAWEGLSPNLYSFQMRCLILATTHINDFLGLQSEKNVDDFQHHHLTMALRREDLDQTLQEMQQEGDFYLQELIRLLLRGWSGEKCMEILSNELLGLSPKEFEKMLQEALDVVSSDKNLIDTLEE